MKRLLSTFKSMLIVCLAGVLLLSSTACSNAGTLASKANKGGEGIDVPGQVQPYKGGMNNFSDVDNNRLNTKGTDAKAKALIDSAQRRLNQKGIDSPSDLVDNIRSAKPGQQADRIAKDAREGTGYFTGDAKSAADRGADNLKRNLSNVPEQVGKTLDKAQDNLKDAASDLPTGTRNLGDKANKIGQRVSGNVPGTEKRDVKPGDKTYQG